MINEGMYWYIPKYYKLGCINTHMKSFVGVCSALSVSCPTFDAQGPKPEFLIHRNYTCAILTLENLVL